MASRATPWIRPWLRFAFRFAIDFTVQTAALPSLDDWTRGPARDDSPQGGEPLPVKCRSYKILTRGLPVAGFRSTWTGQSNTASTFWAVITSRGSPI